MTLLRLVLREACAASAYGPGGLSWPDFLDRHANAGVALAVCGLTLVLLLVMVGFALAAWRMGRKQGRPWSVFFGLASVGAEVPAQDSLEKLSSSVAQLEALLARIPNAGELASADAQSFEMYKLAMVLSQLLPRLTVEEDCPTADRFVGATGTESVTGVDVARVPVPMSLMALTPKT